MLSTEEKASLNVDALVNDVDLELDSRQLFNNTFTDFARPPTTTVPPGFSSFAKVNPAEEETVQPKSPDVPSHLPSVVPVVPAMPVRPVTPVDLHKHKLVVGSTAIPNDVSEPKPAPAKRKPDPITPVRSTKVLPMRDIPSHEIPSPMTNDGTPAAEKIKSQGSAVNTPIKVTPKSKKESKKGQGNAAVAATSKKDGKVGSAPTTSLDSSKRHHPGKLDITAATTEENMGQDFTV